MSIRALGPTQPPIQCVLAFFPGGKVAGPEVHYSSAITAKVGRSDTSTSSTKFLHITESHKFIYFFAFTASYFMEDLEWFM